MFDWLRRWTGGLSKAAPARSAPAIRARYDNAQFTDETQRNWWMADYFSAKSANNYQVRRNLRIRSRYEVANNPYLFGICNNNADDLIGTGPTLQVTTTDERYNRLVQDAWREWAAEVALVEKLRTCKLANTVDGEGFLIFKTVEDLENPVKLYPCDLEADQITTPMPRDLMELWVDGLDLHPVTGRPIAYHVLKHHPGDLFFPTLNPLSVDKVPARFVVHWFNKFRPGQVRGVPVFTSALDLFVELRSYRRAILAKAQLAANLTAVLESEAPPDPDGTETPEPWDNIPIDRGTMTTVPAGSKLKQYDTGEPGSTYEGFHEHCLGEACRPLAYPLNRALGTSQKFNFSSAKLDHIDYRNGLKIERKNGCEKIVLEPTFRAWFEEAQKLGLIPRRTLTETPHEWHWPGFPVLDPGVDTQADINELNAGTQMWREFWAERGYDWRDVMRQQAAEKEEIQRLKLVFGEPLKKSERVDKGAGGNPAAAEATVNLKIAASDWDENKHPRDDHGRFGEGGGSHGDHQGGGFEDEVRKLPATERARVEKAHARASSALSESHDKIARNLGAANANKILAEAQALAEKTGTGSSVADLLKTVPAAVIAAAVKVHNEAMAIFRRALGRANRPTKPLPEIRPASFRNAVGLASVQLDHMGVKDWRGEDLHKAPALRSYALKTPGLFDRQIEMVRLSFQGAMHFADDPQESRAIRGKIDEIDRLRAAVNHFRARQTPEVPQAPAKPHHKGKKGAGKLNTSHALKHLADGGDPRSAVAAVMAFGRLKESTAKRYVRAAVKIAARHERDAA